jgi:hypothetical protein
VSGGIPDDEVVAFARLRGLPVGSTRRETVATIEEYLRRRGERAAFPNPAMGR